MNISRRRASALIAFLSVTTMGTTLGMGWLAFELTMSWPRWCLALLLVALEFPLAYGFVETTQVVWRNARPSEQRTKAATEWYQAPSGREVRRDLAIALPVCVLSSAVLILAIQSLPKWAQVLSGTLFFLAVILSAPWFASWRNRRRAQKRIASQP